MITLRAIVKSQVENASSLRRESAFRKARSKTSATRSSAGAQVTIQQSRQAAVGLSDGAVVIAAITSCTNTSNPTVMVGAGLLAKRAVEKGLIAKPWVKRSLAPGSTVVTDYLRNSGLLRYLDDLGFNLVGYGCTTCIGNSGPLAPEIETEIKSGDLYAVAVLSGNRNFDGRIHPLVKGSFLMSPMLVVACAVVVFAGVEVLRVPPPHRRGPARHQAAPG